MPESIYDFRTFIDTDNERKWHLSDKLGRCPGRTEWQLSVQETKQSDLPLVGFRRPLPRCTGCLRFTKKRLPLSPLKRRNQAAISIRKFPPYDTRRDGFRLQGAIQYNDMRSPEVLLDLYNLSLNMDI
jgi:hypothetical protein